MAEKPILNYKPAKMQNPANRSETIFTPVITDRDRSVTLAKIVEEAIDRGLVLGMKAEGAEAVAKGILTQLGKELNNGKDVVFGDYFRTQLNLTGTVDGLLDTVDSENQLKLSIIPGKAYKLDRENYTFRNLLVTGEIPEIDYVQNDYGEEGTIALDAPMQIFGRHLKVDLTRSDYVAVWNAVQSGDTWTKGTIAATIESQSYFKTNSDKMLRVDLSGASLQADHRYFVQVVKHQLVNGESVPVETKLVLVTATAV